MSEIKETFYKNFNLYSHITNPVIRNWNRLVQILNIIKQVNVKEAAMYRSELPKDEQQELITLFDRMKVEGFTALQNEARSHV